MSYIISFVSSIVSAMLLFLLQSYIKENRKLKRENEEKRSKRDTALEDGVVCILRKHLMDEHETWVAKGFITPKALESGLLMYKAYKALGGNGMIDHMEEEIQELPIKD
jgi:hypothetical protein